MDGTVTLYAAVVESPIKRALMENNNNIFMYAPIAADAPHSGCLTPRMLASLCLLGVLVTGLVLTYQTCVACVLGIALVSLLLIQVVPMMPVVFLVSMAVLLYHSVDYHAATIKVEVPLSNLVYVPTYDDFKKYVHLTPHGSPQINADTPGVDVGPSS